MIKLRLTSKKILYLLSVLMVQSFLMNSAYAIQSLSDLQIPPEDFATVTSEFSTLSTTIAPLIDRTTFAREEFLRLRAETRGKGVEYQASHNYLRSQIRALYSSLNSDEKIKSQSKILFRRISKSPQLIRDYLATRPVAYLPAECPPAIPLDGESIWETGKVVRVEDGDTVEVQTCRGNLNVRLIGVQAAETVKSYHFAQCGGAEASNFMKKLLPIGSEVQLRSNNYASANNYEALARPYRYIFAKDAQGNFTIDVQRQLLDAGLAMWFPNENEYVRNYQYLEALNQAAQKGLGLWSGSFCGNESDNTPLGAIELWIETDSPLPNENPFGEYVLLKNKTNVDINLSGWSIRDTSLDLFDPKYAFPVGTILRAGGILTVYIGSPLNNFPLAPDEISLGLNKAILQNPSPVGGKYTGDGIYLQTPLLANGGGNMRAWMHRPCIPTDCPKPEWVTKNLDGSVRNIPLPQTLSLALNPGKYGRIVPNMAGLTEQQAKVALVPLELAVTLIDKSNGAVGDKNVIDQNPKPGAYLPPNGTVTVYLDVKR